MPNSIKEEGFEHETANIALPVAIYVRMSTDHQIYSTRNQEGIIRSYAAKRNMEITEIFSDSGKSGLYMKGRRGLQRLIYQIENGVAQFKAILVYDISRWGRFQDADESAYYEYICKRAGVDIHYCAEQFNNDGSPVSTIVKSIKRAMAGEYSRELSVKVFEGQCRLTELGYRQGGSAGYGLRRMLIDETGGEKGILHIGQQKNLQTDRVTLVPGPQNEVKTVRRIYHLFVNKEKREYEIAKILNNEGILTDLGRVWTRKTIQQVLSNEKYIGNNVFNRTSFKLRKRRIFNDPEMWVRAQNVYNAIIPKTTFEKASRIIKERAQKLSDAEMLSILSKLHQKHGRLTKSIIDDAKGTPSSDAFYSRFGGLLKAYKLVKCKPSRNFRYVEIDKHLREFQPIILDDIMRQISQLGARATLISQNGILHINEEFKVSVSIARHNTTRGGNPSWTARPKTSSPVDITLVVRMRPDNKEILDYYIFPHMDFSNKAICLSSDNGAILDSFRFETLDLLFYISERISIKEVPKWEK